MCLTERRQTNSIVSLQAEGTQALGRLSSSRVVSDSKDFGLGAMRRSNGWLSWSAGGGFTMGFLTWILIHSRDLSKRLFARTSRF
jgi:hypothetical protein